MEPMPESTRRAGRLAALAATAGAAAGLLWLGGRTGDGGGHAIGPFLRTLALEGGTALAWWLGALGLGLGLMRAVVGPSVSTIAGAARIDALASPTHRAGPRERTDLDELAIALWLGASALLAAVALAGTLGLFAATGPVAAWAPVALGAGLAVRFLREAPIAGDGAPAIPAWSLAGVGAIAALAALAASSAPGWLWSSEFGGYDALGYHLELPKRWLVDRTGFGPVEGNLYSALPSFVEGAFAQLMLMRGDIHEGAVACQWWALGALAATVLATARLARSVGGATAGAVAALALLATPWMLVVGTLAYNDVVPAGLLAAGWLLLRRTGGPRLDGRAAAALALLAAAAVGAKPTAALFTVGPLVAIAVVERGSRVLRQAPLAAVVGTAVLAPWLVRNGLAYGNPLWPFAHGLLGDGPWSPGQFKVFAAAHGPAGGPGERLALVWREWIAHGFGPAPAPGEPWFPQWGALPAAGLAGLAIAARRGDSGRAARAALAAIAVALAGWLLATHLKSRFLLPTAVPLALGAGLLATAGPLARHPRPVIAAWSLALLLPCALFLREPVRGEALGAPAALVGGVPLMTGDAVAAMLAAASDDDARRAILGAASTPVVVNHLLPPDARLVGVGFATPFYLRRPIATATVFDRGPFERVAEAAPDDARSWGASLRAQGFTHALVDPTMLERWAASGWLAPVLADGGWLAPFVESNRLRLRTSDGKLVVELLPSGGPGLDPAAADGTATAAPAAAQPGDPG
jgi:hypothetical protein